MNMEVSHLREVLRLLLLFFIFFYCSKQSFEIRYILNKVRAHTLAYKKITENSSSNQLV